MRIDCLDDAETLVINPVGECEDDWEKSVDRLNEEESTQQIA